MKIILVAGFLGSGKTTTILELARYLTADADPETGPEAGTRLAVLVNEAGDIPMDGAVLTAAGNRVKEIFAGCVCCQVASSLVLAVRELETMNELDYLLIEPSGLADPARIHMLLPRAGQETWRSLYLVDVPRFAILLQAARPIIENGVRGADVVLANKADQGDDDALAELTAAVAAIDDTVPVVPVSAQDGIAPAMWRQILAHGE